MNNVFNWLTWISCFGHFKKMMGSFIPWEIDGYFCNQFNKDSGKVIEECKLRVVYTLANRNSGDGSFASSNENADYNSVSSIKILCCGLKSIIICAIWWSYCLFVYLFIFPVFRGELFMLHFLLSVLHWSCDNFHAL